MTISIEASLLTAYYDAKAGVSTGSSSSGGSSSTSSVKPTTPWATTPTAAKTNAAVTSVLDGSQFFNPNTTKLTIPTTTTNYGNYKNLFTLYQGLTTLQALATEANSANTSAYQLSQLQTAFSNGMQQLQSYLNGSPFTGFNIAEGAVATSDTSTGGVTQETDTYTTGVLVTGSNNDVVQSFEGNVSFAMTVTQTPITVGDQVIQSNAPPVTVDFNLNDMGSTPRTLSNVINYMNGQLETAGVDTRFADVATPGNATTYTVNGQTYTNPAGPTQYALEIVGTPIETLTFSASDATAGVYITQTAGTNGNATTTGTGNTTTSGNTTASQQLLKLTTDPTASQAQVFNDTLSQSVTNAIATATSSDGSVYVLANVTGSTPAGQLEGSNSIAGTQDVALMKYDSAGNLIWAQPLGSTQSASGLSLAVSADGSQVAVVGTGTGLNDNNGSAPSDATDPTGFVSVYDNQGDPVWSQAVNDWTQGQVTNAVFGSDGSLYVSGSTQISDTISDSFVAGFSPSGVQTFDTYLGATDSTGNIAGIAVDGSNLITAGVQNGDVVVQSYSLTSGTPVLSATEDLGAVGMGSVSGVGVTSGGSIIVAGTTDNGNLSDGTVGSAYTGGQEAFAATLNGNLTPSASDTIGYFSGGNDTVTTGVTVANDQAYITGTVATATMAGFGESTAFNGFAAQIDPTSGNVVWSNVFIGPENEAVPTSIAVDPAGASSLDALGLPSGTISFTPSQYLVANTGLQAGDQFSIVTNYDSTPQTITVGADDTLQTLAQKITAASGYTASVQVTTVNGQQELEITPGSSSVQITLEAGPAGKNALPALGLTQGLITNNATAKAKSATSIAGSKPTTTLKANYGLGMDSTLSLNSSGDIANALAQLGAAITTVKQIYTNMTTAPSTTKSSGGSVPAYLTAEISSYQAALNRLENSNSSSSSSSLASLL